MSRKRNYLALRDPQDTLDLGRLVAEQDEHLAQYYVADERYLRRALDVNDPATFFIGPKGIGKSAILKMVALRQRTSGGRVIEIRPDDLAFSSLANLQAISPILGDAGKYQWLFKTLWDYVLSLEVLKREFPEPVVLTNWFENIFRGKYEKQARKLVQISQGEGQSLTTRILQLVHEVELSGEYAGGRIAGKVKLDPGDSAATSSLELLSLVNNVARVLRDKLTHVYHIVIDDLDLYWSDTPIQNAFIAALFTSLGHFSRPPKLKAVVALRDNIYDALPIVDRDKQPDVICRVKWDTQSVRAMIEQRLVFKLRVSKNEIWGTLLPEDAFSQILRHCNGRPREAIRLTTLAVTTAAENGHHQVSEDDLSAAVRQFSDERIREVASEWTYKFPGLEQLIRKMSGWPKEFPLERVREHVELLNLEIQIGEVGAEKYQWVAGYAQNPVGFASLMLELGIFWLKLSRTDEPRRFDPANPVEITFDRWFAIHPMFGPGLGLVGA